MTRTQLALLLVGVVLFNSCGAGANYPTPEGPRYSDRPEGIDSPRVTPDTLRLVSFNIKYGEQMDSALYLLATHPELRAADILLLQEVDNHGTQRIARSFGFGYVYYPAMKRANTGRDFGNAVVARFPIIADRKIVLPHMARLAGSQRTATAATLQMGDALVRVYSVHLGTFVNVSPGQRRDQLRAVLADAAHYRRVIIGGDLNNKAVGDAARQSGYSWPTEQGPRTVVLGRWDHIFLKGLAVVDSAASGTINDVHHASDHHPIWLRVILR